MKTKSAVVSVAVTRIPNPTKDLYDFFSDDELIYRLRRLLRDYHHRDSITVSGETYDVVSDGYRVSIESKGGYRVPHYDIPLNTMFELRDKFREFIQRWEKRQFPHSRIAFC